MKWLSRAPSARDRSRSVRNGGAAALSAQTTNVEAAENVSTGNNRFIV